MSEQKININGVTLAGMYSLSHYVIDWDRVTSLDDMKRLIKAMGITFEPNVPSLADIRDLVKEEKKHLPAIMSHPDKEG